MDLRETGWGGMDWIDLAQDRDQRTGPVNTVMNFGFRKILENSCAVEPIAASQEGLSSIKLVN
jgi:hypothetical protein